MLPKEVFDGIGSFFVFLIIVGILMGIGITSLAKMAWKSGWIPAVTIEWKESK